MTLDQLATIAEITAGFGLIISLIFVGWQMRLSMKLTKIEMFANMSARVDEVRAQVLGDPTLAGILLKAESDFAALTPEERVKFAVHVKSLFNIADVMSNTDHEGLTSTLSANQGRQYFQGLVASPARKAWWDRHAHEYSPLLQNEIQAAEARVAAP